MKVSWVVPVFLAIFAALGRVSDLEGCKTFADVLCLTYLLHLAFLGIRALRTPRPRTSIIFLSSSARVPTSPSQGPATPLALLR